MLLTAQNIGKKFNYEWIFRKINFSINTGNVCALTGPNGSGKSTLLGLISGYHSATEGNISVQDAPDAPTRPCAYTDIVLAAPYMELIEELTLHELLEFHSKFVPIKGNLSANEMADFMQLSHARSKYLRLFSSGMKQRVKLGLAFLTDRPVLLLDEPTSNLDAAAIDWYLTSISNETSQRITVICSNDPHEYRFATQTIDILAFK